MSILEIKNMILEEIEREQKLIAYMEKRKLLVPNGSLCVSPRKGGTYYSNVFYSDKKRETVYLSSKKHEDRKKIQLLKEKKNIKYGLPILQNNVNALSDLLGVIKEYNPLETGFGNCLGPEYYLDDEVCIEEWLNEQYIRNPFMPEHLVHETKRGEMVRSKSEMMIADFAYEHDLLYRPESPIRVNGRIIYPDFEFVHEPTRKKKWWEHFGKMHDPEYGVKALRRLEELAQCGIVIGKNLIITWEGDGFPLTRSVITKKFRENGFI